MRFVGDVHGKFKSYIECVKHSTHSIQVGDFGVGFPADNEYAGYDDLIKNWHTNNPTHKFIRGNHDNPTTCKQMPGFIPDGTYDETFGIFYIGGAASKDREMRYSGIDWWPEEELSYGELNAIVDKYEAIKPNIVVSHDCPVNVINPLFKHQYIEQSRTRLALASLFEIHKPDLWVFGHYHMHRREKINGCEFICLHELQVIDIEL